MITMDINKLALIFLLYGVGLTIIIWYIADKKGRRVEDETDLKDKQLVSMRRQLEEDKHYIERNAELELNYIRKDTGSELKFLRKECESQLDYFTNENTIPILEKVIAREEALTNRQSDFIERKVISDNPVRDTPNSVTLKTKKKGKKIRINVEGNKVI